MKRFCFPTLSASDMLSASLFHGVSLRYMFAVVKNLYLSTVTQGALIVKSRRCTRLRKKYYYQD